MNTVSSSDSADLEHRYWNGWNDRAAEGQFSCSNSGKLLAPDAFQPWAPGEPNGGTLENCGIVEAGMDVWLDTECCDKYCSFCKIEKMPKIQMRGKYHMKGNAVLLKHFFSYSNQINCSLQLVS